MTYREAYRTVCDRLKSSGCGCADSPEFDASCLLEQFGGISRGELPLRGDGEMPPEPAARLMTAAEQRADGRPLQYILGNWDFLSLTLEVGEGVLIPRPDTEMLCETAAGRLKGKKTSRVLDLCAGSGCVGLGLASLCPGAEVTAVELSDGAMAYLRRNCARYPSLHVTPVTADVLKDAGRFDVGYDAVLSNPPYIPAKDVPALMKEVRCEPVMALDGGDGLVFYRAIAERWIPKLVPGGFCAVEVGIGQASAVAALFAAAGLCGIEITRDYGGIERVVAGRKVLQTVP